MSGISSNWSVFLHYQLRNILMITTLLGFISYLPLYFRPHTEHTPHAYLQHLVKRWPPASSTLIQCHSRLETVKSSSQTPHFSDEEA